jgi:hypothetical protein
LRLVAAQFVAADQGGSCHQRSGRPQTSVRPMLGPYLPVR